MLEEFLPAGFYFDAERRVARDCPRCEEPTYAPGPSAWESKYWKHSNSNEYACADGVFP